LILHDFAIPEQKAVRHFDRLGAFANSKPDSGIFLNVLHTVAAVVSNGPRREIDIGQPLARHEAARNSGKVLLPAWSNPATLYLAAVFLAVKSKCHASIFAGQSSLLDFGPLRFIAILRHLAKVTISKGSNRYGEGFGSHLPLTRQIFMGFAGHCLSSREAISYIQSLD
jgi:hypothetical protein